MHEALEALAGEGYLHQRPARSAVPVQRRDLRLRRLALQGVRGRAEPRRAAEELLVNDAGINPASLISILHYDGTPITARFITKEIGEIVSALNVRPIKKDKAA